MAEHQQWIYPGTIPLPFWDFYFKELYSSIASVMLIPAFLSALIMAIFLFILTDEAYKSEGSDDDQKYLSTGSQYFLWCIIMFLGLIISLCYTVYTFYTK